MTEALLAVDFLADTPRQIAIVWPDGAATAGGAPLLAVLRRHLPAARALAGGPESAIEALAQTIPFVARQVAQGGRPTGLRLPSRSLRAAGQRCGSAGGETRARCSLSRLQAACLASSACSDHERDQGIDRRRLRHPGPLAHGHHPRKSDAAVASSLGWPTDVKHPYENAFLFDRIELGLQPIAQLFR
jgi:hypothetical protein